jgi:hypothetical protein
VTYRVLCLTDALVLALPPKQTGAEAEGSGAVRSYVHK